MLKSQIQLSQYDRCQTQLSKEFKQCRPFQIYQSTLGFSRILRFPRENRGENRKSGTIFWVIHGFSSTIIYTSELILCYTNCVPSATRHNIHMYPYFLFAAIRHLKSSPTFSVRPCSSVGKVTVDLIRRSWVRFPPRSKDFFFASCGSLFPLTRANAQWVIHGFSSTIIYTSELILCYTICVPSATRHNIHMYPY